MMRTLLCTIFILFAIRLEAQVADSSVIELSSIRFVEDSESRFQFLWTPRDSLAVKNIPDLNFTNPFPWKGIPDMLMEMDCYVKFSLHNGDDTARKVYFIPGYYLKTYDLYEADPENVHTNFRPVLPDTQKVTSYSACKAITLLPHQKKVYFAKFTFLRTQVNAFEPSVVSKNSLRVWVLINKNRMGYLNMVTYLASGILLLMIFYSLAVYAQNRHREFIYYSAYVFCTGIMLFLKSFLDFQPTPFNLFFEEYLDIIIICTGVFFYLGFIRTF